MRWINILLLGVGVAACLVALGKLLPLIQKAGGGFDFRRLDVLVPAAEGVQAAAGVLVGLLVLAAARRADVVWIVLFHCLPALPLRQASSSTGELLHDRTLSAWRTLRRIIAADP